MVIQSCFGALNLLEIGLQCVRVCLCLHICACLECFLFICRVITLLFSKSVHSLNLTLLLFYLCRCFFPSDDFVSDDLLLIISPSLLRVMVFTPRCSEEEKI